jgi:hypothetical protein
LPRDFDKQKTYLLTSHLERDDLNAEILKENGTPEDTGTGTDIIEEEDGYVLVVKGYYVGEYFTILTF